MAASLDFYFDFSSPYGYLASQRIDDLAARHGREVVWRPVLLGVIFQTTGTGPLTTLPLKGEYSKHDFARSARYYGIPYRLPSVFPSATQTAARAYYWLADRDPAAARRLAHALFRAYFVDDRNISSPEVTLQVAEEQGVDRAELGEALQDPRLKDRLRAEVDAALARGVFGSPYVIVDGEPFWGADRLDQLERWLASGGW